MNTGLAIFLTIYALMIVAKLVGDRRWLRPAVWITATWFVLCFLTSGDPLGTGIEILP